MQLFTDKSISLAKACRFKVTGWLAKKCKSPRAAEAHYCQPDTSSSVSTDASASVRKETASASMQKETASASVQTDDMDIAALTHFFNGLLVDDQMTVLSDLFSVYMLNSFGINIPDDFLSYAANAMLQLRLGQCTNV